MKYGTQFLGKWIAIALAILLLPLSSFAVAAEEILDVSMAEVDTETKIETSSLMPCLYITIEIHAISLSDLKSNSYQVAVSVYADVDVTGGCTFGIISDEGATYCDFEADNVSVKTVAPSNQDSQFVWVALSAALETVEAGTLLCTLTYTIDSSVKTGYVYCFSLEKQNCAGTQGQINNEDYTYGSLATITIVDTPSTSTIETTTTSSIQTGDADLDGSITIQYASITLQYYAQLAEGNCSALLEGDGLTAADANGDGSITIQDAAWILEYYAESAAGKTPSWETLIG